MGKRITLLKSCYIFDALRRTSMNISREMSNSVCKSSSPLRNWHEMCIKANNLFNTSQHISAHISFRYCNNLISSSFPVNVPTVRDVSLIFDLGGRLLSKRVWCSKTKQAAHMPSARSRWTWTSLLAFLSLWLPVAVSNRIIHDLTSSLKRRSTY